MKIFSYAFSFFILLTLNLYSANDKNTPNFLIIVADDMAFTDIGTYGSEIETPNIDALAKKGVKFTQFYVSVSCSPTRAMLLSGTDNHQAGLGNMGELLTESQKGAPGYEGHLNNSVVTIAEVLKDNGYHTYMAGKWHLGHEPEQYPHSRGFEKSFSMMFGGASHWSDMYGLIYLQTPAIYTKNGEKLDKIPKDFYSSRSYTDFLIDSIRENLDDGKPFLAYLAFTAPHDPLHVPEPWLSKYRGAYDEGYEVLHKKRFNAAKKAGVVPESANMPKPYSSVKPWDTLADEEKALEARRMEVYAGMVDNIDYNVGRVIKFLKDTGQYDNTIIIFMSDNGANPWEMNEYPVPNQEEFLKQFDNSLENIGHPNSAIAYGIGWATAGVGPKYLFKMTVAEGGISSPLIISGPGIADNGRTIESFAYVTNIMPTILEMADSKHPKVYNGNKIHPLDGKSLLPVLTAKSDKIYSDEDVIAGEMLGGKWVRQGQYKAVMIAPPYGSNKWELYDISIDPGETNNLASTKPEKLKTLVDEYEKYAERVGVVPPN